MSHLQLSKRTLCQSAITASSTHLSLSSLHSWLSLSSSSRSSPVLFSRSVLPSSSSSSTRHSFHLSPRRSFAAVPKKDAKKGAKKEEAPPDPNRPIDVSFIHSWKADPIPKLQADSAYPEWIFDHTLYNPPSLAELRVRKDQGEQLSEELVKRMDKLERRRHIKQRNDESRKA